VGGGFYVLMLRWKAPFPFISLFIVIVIIN
jgi:hypothetical protein